MRWNKVRARVKYKSGPYTVYLFAPDFVKVGEHATCLVLSGYEASCEVLDIVKENVRSNTRHGKILTTERRVDEPEAEEEIIMSTIINEVFATVFVQNSRGVTYKCKALAPIRQDAEVVYEGTDKNLHVGIAVNCYEAGVPFSANAYTAAGFVVQVVNRSAYEEAVLKEQTYNSIMDELKVRKKAIEERAIWQILADQDPRAKELLATLDAMKGGAQL